jgi:hypothetical protein
MENVGIALTQGGSGNVIRGNRLQGMFNGISTVTGLGDNQGDTDIYYNWVHDIGDDGLEPEDGNINLRAWCNTVYNAQNGVSLAPIGEGPVWLLYNVIADFREAGLKISNDTTGVVRAYHNTIVTTRPNANALNPWTAFANISLRNNIVMGTRYVIEDYYAPTGQGVDLAGDLLFTTDAGRFVKWQGTRYNTLAEMQRATGLEAGARFGDPQFPGASYGDFRLPPGSPARHAATPIPGISDFLGSAPDIGAYQMGG